MIELFYIFKKEKGANILFWWELDVKGFINPYDENYCIKLLFSLDDLMWLVWDFEPLISDTHDNDLLEKVYTMIAVIVECDRGHSYYLA